MKHFCTAIILIWMFLGFTLRTHAEGLPTERDMQDLRPQPSPRLNLYDRLFPSIAHSADEAHQLYTNPAMLADVERRLQRVRQTGNPEDILDAKEWTQFLENRTVLRGLESNFFARWYLRNPMDAAVRMQRWITERNSPEPQGRQREVIALRLREEMQKNILYSTWHEELPAELKEARGPQTWGELLLRFNEDSIFRSLWINKHPDRLSDLTELAKVWAWDDSTVRSVSVHHSGTPAEYWVLDRRYRFLVPNRFLMKINGDVDGLVRLEFATSVFFNRVSKVEKKGSTIVYSLEAVEKGRTMELTAEAEEGSRKQTFSGAELLRKSKADEFLQRSYIQRGTLNLFLGLRTIQLDQVQELRRRYPEMMLAVGQFGFSITGGRAQTVSNRTDSPEAQMRKLTATLIDIIEFAHTKDVPLWFEDNTSQVLRTIFGGVGAGGAKALDPRSQDKVTRSCRQLFVKSL